MCVCGCVFVTGTLVCLQVAHSLLPLRNCFSAYGGGFLISASEDKEVSQTIRSHRRTAFVHPSVKTSGTSVSVCVCVCLWCLCLQIYIYSLAKSANYKMHYLKHHNVQYKQPPHPHTRAINFIMCLLLSLCRSVIQAPVLAVAVNALDTLIASADSLGNIVLWRRLDFSHTGDS